MNVPWNDLIEQLLKQAKLSPSGLKPYITTLAPRLTSNPRAQALWATVFDAPDNQWPMRLQQALAMSGLPDTISETQWRQWLRQEPVHIADGTDDHLFFDAMQIGASRLNSIEWPPGSEKGQDILPFLKTANVNPGSHWCMVFVYWAVSQAHAARGTHKPNPLKQTGSCYEQWQFALREHKHPQGTVSFLTAEEAIDHQERVRPGAIFILQYKKTEESATHEGHTGFVQSVGPGGSLVTIEGNTNPFGWPRVGLGVYQCSHRTLKDKTLMGFILPREGA